MKKEIGIPKNAVLYRGDISLADDDIEGRAPNDKRIEQMTLGLPSSPKKFKRQAWKRLRHLAEAFSPFWREEG